MLYYIMLYYIMSHYVMLYYVMLYYIILYYVIISVFSMTFSGKKQKLTPYTKSYYIGNFMSLMLLMLFV